MSPLNYGGAERVRTDDLLNANQPLFQLSYGPQSPRPFQVSHYLMNYTAHKILTKYNRANLHPNPYRHFHASEFLLRKEVIQPQVPLRLPCYDLVPITSLALGRCPPCELAHELRAKPAFMT